MYILKFTLSNNIKLYNIFMSSSNNLCINEKNKIYMNYLQIQKKLAKIVIIFKTLGD